MKIEKLYSTHADKYVALFIFILWLGAIYSGHNTRIVIMGLSHVSTLSYFIAKYYQRHRIMEDAALITGFLTGFSAIVAGGGLWEPASYLYVLGFFCIFGYFGRHSSFTPLSFVSWLATHIDDCLRAQWLANTPR